MKWANLLAWHSTEAPKQEWEVDGFIPRGIVTLLYGDGGVGKTLAIHQYAVAAAAGLPWLGQQTRPARVMCVFCEDEEDELHRRHRAILKASGADGQAVNDRLRIVSRVGEDNILMALSRSSGVMQRTAFWHQLRNEAVAWGADVLIVDTIADTYGGSEIDRGQVNQFVKAGLGGLGMAIGGSCIALGHPSVAGKAEGRSGSTAWSNAARSRLYLRRPAKQEKGNMRELEGMKSNRGPLGNLLQLRWQAGAFALVAASAKIDLNAFKDQAEIAGRAPTVEEREDLAVLAAIGAARASGVPLGLNPRAHTTYAPRVLRATFGDLMGTVRGEDSVVEAAMARLMRDGRIQATTWRVPGRRYDVAGFAPVAVEPAEGVFS